MIRASYRVAVAWVALNDNSGNGDSQDEVEGYITTGLVADIFGTTVQRVAKDVCRARRREDLAVG